MQFLHIYFAILLLIICIIPFTEAIFKGVIVFLLVCLNSVISGYLAFNSLSGQTYELILTGSLVTGPIPLRIDSLSGIFLLIVNFVFITGCLYGLFYMRKYSSQKNNINLHAISFIFLHSSLIGLCIIQNSLLFLIFWEIMALSAFLLVIFEHEKVFTIKAGINYLIQSHLCIVFLMIGFLWVALETGSYDFKAIGDFTSGNRAAALLLFSCFFTGFALKAGFVPFHTWLPYAHPAAPAHISGIMSGVLIKIGIFGILRMILLIKTDYLIVGYIILTFSVISGLYGVMLAIIQHNLKKLLAYHSIENIGIIGIGIGIGCIGLGNGNSIVASLGFAGALLHVINHALFKSLLFYASGNVYQGAHNLNIESLGGLIKKMPHTAILFLIGSVAICGIPPFNGFISEFLIYTGLYQWFHDASLVSLIAIIFSVLALVITGGLAVICFTKAFGVVFLGSPRSELTNDIKEVPLMQLVPMYLLTLFVILIGLFPALFINYISAPVNMLAGNVSQLTRLTGFDNFKTLQSVSFASWGLIIVVILILFIRFYFNPVKCGITRSTWACGYSSVTPKQQYTANSFARSYSKLFSFIILSYRSEKVPSGIFPTEGHYETHAYDKIEKIFIDNPLRLYRSFMGKFIFLQNGRLQFYILYGIIFIISVICIPLFYEKISKFLDYLKLM